MKVFFLQTSMPADPVLPFVSKVLADNGYSTAFYYGGDIDFFNLRSYLINGDFKEIISEKDFPSSQDITSWGVPDHIMFERFLEDIDNDTDMPFFKVFFTLSNHEPFDIPVKSRLILNCLMLHFIPTAV